MNYGKNAIRRRAAEIDSVPIKLKNKTGVLLCKVLMACLLLVATVGISTGVGIWKGIIDSAPDISEIDVIPTGYQTTVLASDGTNIATLVASGANRKYVTIDEIPIDLQHAFVAIEDERFYEHNGIDFKGILRAASVLIRTRSMSEGASTITQQLIKNSVLVDKWAKENSGESSDLEKIQRKIQEQYLAIELEAQVKDKDWILENYLNTINLGANTLGVQAASERYFGKDVSEINLSEAAVIASITQNPYQYNPIRFPEENAKRRAKVLKNMREQGYITQEAYDEAIADDVYARIMEHDIIDDNDTNTVNSYFVDALIDDIYYDLMNVKGYSETEAYKAVYQGGLTIYSTQDLDLQEICDEEANNLENYPNNPEYSFMLSFQVKKGDGTYEKYTHQTMLAYYKEVNNNNNYSINYSSEERAREAIAEYEDAMIDEENGDEMVEGSESITITLQPEVAMTLIDHNTGEVKAMVGGRGEKTSNRTWNRATDTTRQPGSTFKIIACYAPAIDGGGMTLATTQIDEPYTVGNKTYKNAGGSYRGRASIRTAITHSINIVTVKTLEEIGINMGYEYAEKFGITTLDPERDMNLGLSLGGLTYGVRNLELTAAYAAIANKGEYVKPSFYTKVLDHNGNVLLDKSCKDHHQVISEQSAWLITNAMQDVMTAGTGTKVYFGDSMAQAGKTGTTTSNRDSLFAGFTPYYTMVIWGGYDDNAKQSSTIYTKNIWRNAMKRIHEGLEYRDFEEPVGISESKLCSRTGLYANSGCGTVTEYMDETNMLLGECYLHSNSSGSHSKPEESSETETTETEETTETQSTEQEKDPIHSSGGISQNGDGTKPSTDQKPQNGTTEPSDTDEPDDDTPDVTPPDADVPSDTPEDPNGDATTDPEDGDPSDSGDQGDATTDPSVEPLGEE